MCGFVSVSSIQFIKMSVLCQYHKVFITIALYYKVKSGKVPPPAVLLPFRIVLTILFFIFPYEVKNYSIKVCKKKCWNFDVHCIESVGHCDHVASLTILLLLIHKCEMFFHLLVFISISFFSVFKFLL